MHTVIAFKWTRNPKDARVSADGAVNWGIAKLSASDDDAAAAVVAAALSAPEDIVGLTIGDGDAAWAAARCAARTVCITDADEGPATAAALAAAVRHIGAVDTVVIGDCDWEPAVPVLVGAHLGWHTIAGVTAASRDGDRLRVTRHTTTGTEDIEITLPAVVAVMARGAEARAPGMKQILAARKKPVERLSIADLDAAPGTATVDPANNLRLRSSQTPQTGTSTVYDGTDPGAAVNQLVNALKGEGVL